MWKYKLSILLWVWVLWLISQWWYVNAWYVPGTIQKGTTTSSPYCSSVGNPYSPTSWYCSAGNSVLSGTKWLYDYSWRTGTTSFSSPSWVSLDSWATCSWETKWTDHISPTSQPTWCANDTASYYVGGSNGSCNVISWNHNRITSFNQVWWISRSAPSTTSACQVEWRYATLDTTWPTITLNNVQDVFMSWTNDFWCNIKKYSEWDDLKNHPGCEEYRKKNPNLPANSNEDLLKWLTVQIWSDPSGIWSVKIELWMCNTTYELINKSLGNIVKSTSSAQWVKDIYKNGFIIPYTWTFNAFWGTQQWLLQKFWKTRLDQCFGEWKNSLIVTVKDMAYNTSSVTSLDSNTTIQKVWTINVDTKQAFVELTNDLNTYQNNDWVNFTLSGWVKVWENVNAWGKTSCELSFSTWSCWSPAAGKVWILPAWVNPTTWAFPQFTCDGLTFPSMSECSQVSVWWGTCTWTPPPVGSTRYNDTGLTWNYIWQNTNPAWECYYSEINYCIAWWKVPCVVKSSIVTTTYSWVEWPWSACDATCWGQKTRTVVCKNSSNVTVADSLCTTTKPATIETCPNTCPPITWNPIIKYNWSCYICSQPRSDGWADYRVNNKYNPLTDKAWLTISIQDACPTWDSCSYDWTISEDAIIGTPTVLKSTFWSQYSLDIEKYCSMWSSEYSSLDYSWNVKITNATRSETKNVPISWWVIELICWTDTAPSIE